MESSEALESASNSKQKRKIINAWAFYDWANSSYPLVISTAIFPIFYDTVTDDFVNFLGFNLSNSQVYTFVVAFSFLLVSIFTPILSGIADYTGDKKRFLRFFCYLGGIATASLYFFDPNQLELSMLSILIASTGFWSSLVFYNAYLPEIVEPHEQDRVSAKGFSLGYLGSAILLIICLVAFKFLEIMPAKFSFVLVGVWWIGFSHYTYAYLPTLPSKELNSGSRLTKGFQELYGVWKEVKINKQLKRYLVAFFIYSMGVQTIMLVAVLFAKKEVSDMPEAGLIISVLIIQFIAIPGSYLFSYSSKKIGNIKTLGAAVIVWAICCVAAFYTYNQYQFYVLAAFVGLIMGGTQALSRSTYSKMLPKTRDNASYFSFYDVSEKVAIVFGMVIFALLEDNGSMRQPTLGLATIFLAALIALFFVPKMKKGISENAPST